LRYWLIDLPAKIVSAILLLQYLIIAIACAAIAVVLLIVLALAALGIRWGY
jgi:hypothetical protein